jgi:hypothetical protein
LSTDARIVLINSRRRAGGSGVTRRNAAKKDKQYSKIARMNFRLIALVQRNAFPESLIDLDG